MIFLNKNMDSTGQEENQNGYLEEANVTCSWNFWAEYHKTILYLPVIKLTWIENIYEYKLSIIYLILCARLGASC